MQSKIWLMFGSKKPQISKNAEQDMAHVWFTNPQISKNAEQDMAHVWFTKTSD